MNRRNLPFSTTYSHHTPSAPEHLSSAPQASASPEPAPAGPEVTLITGLTAHQSQKVLAKTLLQLDQVIVEMENLSSPRRALTQYEYHGILRLKMYRQRQFQNLTPEEQRDAEEILKTLSRFTRG
jgi:hypothetical protein